MRHFRLTLCFCLLIAIAHAKEIKIHGFVTNVNSPTSFEIDDYRITRDTSLVLDIEKDESGLATATFKPEDIRVGTEVEIKGEYNEQTGDLRASSIKVFGEDTRIIKRTALVERVPALVKSGDAWTGTFFADGQRIAITPDTQMSFKPNKREKNSSRNQARRACHSVLSTKSASTHLCTMKVLDCPMVPSVQRKCNFSTPRWKKGKPKCGRI
jgi:hypothetical protein